MKTVYSCMVTLAALLSLTMADPASAELVSWYAFNEGTGTIAADSIGNGPDITLVDATWEEGVSGTAVHFHGAGYGRDTAYSYTDDAITLCTWVWHDTFRTGVERYVTIGGEVAVIRRNSDGRLHFYMTTSGTMRHLYVADVLTEGEWHHVAGTWDGTTQRLIFDGVEIASQTPGGTLADGTMLRLSSPDGEPLNGKLDDVRIYNHALSPQEIAVLMNPTALAEAREPVPAHKETDVPTDAAFAWTPGEFAATHDVYLGTSFDDVNDATEPVGSVTDATFTPEDALEYGQTYYWRVDEVNGAPDYTVFQGDVWNFTVETFAYPIANVTAEASSAQPTSPADNTVNRSGLDDQDQHGVDLKTMWATPAGSLPVSIQYTFDKEYKLDELWVWNSNSELESYMGFGAKDVTIDYSTDGETWTTLENVPEFAKGTGQPTYTANNIIHFGGAMAKHVKLTVNATWGTVGIASLSEVRFFYIPTQAFRPDPVDGATEVRLDATLNWRPGREATSHQVYFGTDVNAVAEGTVSAETVTKHS